MGDIADDVMNDAIDLLCMYGEAWCHVHRCWYLDDEWGCPDCEDGRPSFASQEPWPDD